MKIPLNALVKVAWRDTCAVCRWLDTDSALDWAKKAYNLDHLTVGYLLGINAQFVVIAATSDNEGGYNDVSMIPRSCVKKISRLKDDSHD